jgi:hypothetical protein
VTATTCGAGTGTQPCVVCQRARALGEQQKLCVPTTTALDLDAPNKDRHWQAQWQYLGRHLAGGDMNVFLVFSPTQGTEPPMGTGPGDGNDPRSESPQIGGGGGPGGGPPIPAGKSESGVGVGVDPRSPANRGSGVGMGPRRL